MDKDTDSGAGVKVFEKKLESEDGLRETNQQRCAGGGLRGNRPTRLVFTFG